MAKRALVDGLASGGKDTLWERASHRGHGGHKGGWTLGGETRLAGRLGFRAGKTRLGKEHRTEGTEVTKGDGRWTAKRAWLDGLASGRERHALGKSIAQRARRSQRGMDAGWRNALGWTAWLPGGKDTLWERASHRGHGGHKGGWTLGGETRFGGRLGFRAGNTRIRKKHRTEGTEVTEGDGGWVAQRALVDGLASGRERRPVLNASSCLAVGS